MKYPSDINLLIFAYALGTYTLAELTKILQDVGFSPVIVNVLVAKAEKKKSEIKKDGS